MILDHLIPDSKISPGLRLVHWVRTLIPLFGVLVGLTVVVTYLTTGSAAIIQINSSFAPMKFNTALLLICLSLSIFIDKYSVKWTQFLSLIVLLFSIATLAQYLLNTDFGIDELFVKTELMTFTTHAGRMSPQVSFVFIVVSMAQILRMAHDRYKLLANILSLAGLLLVILSVLEYFTPVTISFAWGNITKMGFHTALVLISLTCVQILSDFKLTKKYMRWTPYAVSFVVLVIGLTFWIRYFDYRSAVLKEQISSKISYEGELVTLLLKDRSYAMLRMADRIIQSAKSQNWDRDIENYFKHYPDLKEIKYGRTKSAEVIDNLSSRPVKAEWQRTYLPKDARKSSQLPVYFYYSRQNTTMMFETDLTEIIEKIVDDKNLYTAISVGDQKFSWGEKASSSLESYWGQAGRFTYQDLNFVLHKTPLLSVLTSNQIQISIGILALIIIGAFLTAYSVELNINLHESHAQQLIANQKLSTLIEAVPVGIYQVDKDGKNVYVSRKWCEITGMTAEMANSDGHDSTLHPEDKELAYREWRQAVATNSLFGSSYRYLHPEKGVVWVKNQAQAIRDHQGHVIGYIGGVLDISREVMQSKMVDEQRLQLIQSERMRSLGQMAGGIAHEINNPLAIIEMQANLIREMSKMDKLTTDMAVNITNTISSLVIRISTIIRGLRAFARDGHQDPFVETILKNTIIDTLALCKDRFERENVELITYYKSEAKIFCRESQISQVLVNLLNNSLDAVANLSKPWIKISLEEDFNWLYIKVVDSGNGIPEPLHMKIMEPFFTTKEVGKGTGLGLSISMGIMRSHGGDLVYEKHAEHTTFTMKFPKENPPTRKI